MLKRLGLSALLFSTVLVAAPALANDVTVGTADPSQGNCYPFSCGPSDGLSWYQEEYAASAFGGSLDVGAITFYGKYAGVMDSASYDIAFYYSSGLTPDRAANQGTLLADWGTFTVGGDMMDTLTFTGQAFHYDPTLGNLLMDVTIHDVTVNNGAYNSFFEADYSSDAVRRTYGDGFVYSGALVTTFSSGAVPEPASWALMIGGFGMVGAAMRRRAAKPGLA